MNQFYQDVIQGLSASPKYLFSKYFYDAEGDKIFQKIMHAPEYYLMNCELEIFKTRCHEITEIFKRFRDGFDLIELGAGDAYKSTELLNCLLDQQLDFTYYPTDISENAIKYIERELPAKLPNVKIKGIVGEYFEALQQSTKMSNKPKIVLFLGSNIGNMPPKEAIGFCENIRKYLSPGDLTLIGFDLKKNPWVIFKAYNDQKGITKEFNLNLLKRINRELNGTFILENFDHYENYDPESGACKSYLFSLKKQEVLIGEQRISFEENELIYMETSHKYSIPEIDEISKKCYFNPVVHLLDSKQWYTDVIWECI